MKARAWLEQAIATVREQRALVEGVGLVVVVVAILLLVGTALHARANALAAERTRLERVAAIVGEWQRTFQPPSSSEQLAWRRADRELGQLGLRAPAQLELIRLVSARAEEVGIGDARVRIIEAGDIAMPDRSADTVLIATADFALRVEYTAGYEATLALLSVLPAALEPHHINMEHASGSVRTALVLTVYIVEGHETEQDSPVAAIGGSAAARGAGGARRPLGGDARAAGSATR